MSEYRSKLERIGDRVRPAEDAFDRLERRRARKRRTRRIATAVLAFVIAIAGSFAAFEAFRGSKTTIAVGGEQAFHALWPETSLTDAERAQDAVDAGEADTRWRLDARTTAGRFASQVLGWSETALTVPEGADLEGAGPVALEISTLPVPCPFPPPPTCLQRKASVVLERLLRPDTTGIWSVVEVQSPGSAATGDQRLAVPLDVGAEVVSGQEVSLPFSVPHGTELWAGWTYLGECSASSSLGSVRPNHADVMVFAVADSTFSEDCGSGASGGGGGMEPGSLEQPVDGYVFVELVLSGAGGGDPIGNAENGGSTDNPESLVALAAVPVRFVPAEVGSAPPTPIVAAPDVAEITCDGTSTEVVTPEVVAQPDGVHVRVTNTSSTDLSFQFRGGGDSAPVGESEFVRSLAPGAVDVRCLDPALDAGIPGGWVFLTVVDPAGIYRAPVLECAGGETVTGNVDYVEGAAGWTDDPVDITREHAIGVLPTDEVSYAGYPKQAPPQVRVVRDGAVVAVFNFFDDGHGGWLMSSYQACSALGIGGIEAAPTPEYPRGWFEWCPSLDGVLPPGPDAGPEASAVAERFTRAYLRGDLATVADLEDPSVPKGEVPGVTAATDAFSIGGVADDPGGMVEFGCGPDVAASTVTVVVDDGTSSASADFYLYLVLREDGWKVWGSY
jgi:hypothetical protein